MPEEKRLEGAIPLGWFMPEAPPLEVDFGCHRGTFLVGMAYLHPSRNFMGIERQAHRVQRCMEKFQRLALHNALSVQGEGPEALRHWLPNACVSILHISFPDPWPKRRHAARRLVNEEFVHETTRVLRPQGIVRLMTDDAAYFKDMQKCFSNGWHEVPWDDGRETAPTSFERKFTSLGHSVFRTALRLENANRQSSQECPPRLY